LKTVPRLTRRFGWVADRFRLAFCMASPSQKLVSCLTSGPRWALSCCHTLTCWLGQSPRESRSRTLFTDHPVEEHGAGIGPATQGLKSCALPHLVIRACCWARAAIPRSPLSTPARRTICLPKTLGGLEPHPFSPNLGERAGVEPAFSLGAGLEPAPHGLTAALPVELPE
jgi:hypothetical protein